MDVTQMINPDLLGSPILVLRPIRKKVATRRILMTRKLNEKMQMELQRKDQMELQRKIRMMNRRMLLRQEMMEWGRMYLEQFYLRMEMPQRKLLSRANWNRPFPVN